jgi:drug/metabolite transporter (DMT)-like permease
MIIPLIAAISGAVSLIFSKKLLAEKINYRLFASISMIQLFFIMLFLSPVMFDVKASMFTVTSVLLLVFVGGIVAAYNLFFYHGLSEDTLVDAESVIMISPLLTTLLSIVFFVDERNLFIILPAIAAGGALIFSHIRKHHLIFSKGDEYLLLSLGLVAVEALLVKLLLRSFMPFSAYFLRVAIVAFILWVVVRPQFTRLPFRTIIKMAIFNVFVLTSFVLIYSSYKIHGVVFTTLVMTLVPVIVVCWAFIVEREKLELRKFIAIAVILASIFAVQFLLGR